MRTRHEAECEQHYHPSPMLVEIEPCWACESLFSCHEVFETFDPEYPYLCKDCWRVYVLFSHWYCGQQAG